MRHTYTASVVVSDKLCAPSTKRENIPLVFEVYLDAIVPKGTNVELYVFDNEERVVRLIGKSE